MSCCPYCDEEMNSLGVPNKEGFQKIRDIYQCVNQACQGHQQSFYIDQFGDMTEGYPFVRECIHR